MSKSINIELIQDKYTNFVLYDGSDRCDSTVEWVEPKDVTGISVIFTSESDALEIDRHVVIDDTQRAIVQGTVDFLGFDFSAYLAHRNIVIEQNGVVYEVVVTEDTASASDLASLLQAGLGTSMVVTVEGDKINIRSTYSPSVYGDRAPDIEVLGGTLLEMIGIEVGVYRSNFINWGSTLLTADDLRFTIYKEDLNFPEGIPIGKWVVQTIVSYNDGTTSVVVDDYEEFTYKQIELYRASYLENIAKKFNDFDLIEQRMQTLDELSMKSFMTFDSVYKAMLSVIEVGNSLQVSKLLVYLQSYIKLNNITNGE